ncbi:MAG: glycosyltransferase [Pseudomonas sp.]|nr:glycosyltransferase [Pseudomonas sp.]
MSDRLPLVSVIVSCYNHDKYIKECILSVLNQDYRNIELLVVDDGSNDSSVSIINKLKEDYDFYFLEQENKGLTKTLNEAISRSRGEYIVPLGSDDIMLSHRISTQIEYIIDKPEVGICGGNIELIDSDGEFYPESRQGRDTPFRRMNFEDVFLERKPYVPATTLLIRREALDAVGGFDEDNRLEDLMIELKITKAGYYIDCIPVVLSQYRKHATNTYKNHKFMIESILDTYARFADHPDYDFVKYKFLNSMFLKVSNRDHELARELLKSIPFKKWNKKTWRGLLRLYFYPLEK